MTNPEPLERCRDCGKRKVVEGSDMCEACIEALVEFEEAEAWRQMQEYEAEQAKEDDRG